MRDGLAIVAVEQIEAVAIRITGGSRRSQSPFACRRRGESRLFETLGDQPGIGCYGMLTFLEFRKGYGCLAIASNVRVSRVFAAEQHTTSRSADRRTRVVLGETHAIAGKLIDVRRFDFFLTITTEFAPAEIICQNENNMAWTLRRVTHGETNAAEKKANQANRHGMMLLKNHRETSRMNDHEVHPACHSLSAAPSVTKRSVATIDKADCRPEDREISAARPQIHAPAQADVSGFMPCA